MFKINIENRAYPHVPIETRWTLPGKEDRAFPVLCRLMQDFKHLQSFSIALAQTKSIPVKQMLLCNVTLGIISTKGKRKVKVYKNKKNPTQSKL